MSSYRQLLPTFKQCCWGLAKPDQLFSVGTKSRSMAEKVPSVTSVTLLAGGCISAQTQLTLLKGERHTAGYVKQHSLCPLTLEMGQKKAGKC